MAISSLAFFDVPEFLWKKGRDSFYGKIHSEIPTFTDLGITESLKELEKYLSDIAIEVSFKEFHAHTVVVLSLLEIGEKAPVYAALWAIPVIIVTTLLDLAVAITGVVAGLLVGGVLLASSVLSRSSLIMFAGSCIFLPLPLASVVIYGSAPIVCPIVAIAQFVSEKKSC